MPPSPTPDLSPEAAELSQKADAWLYANTHSGGLFDADPTFRPVWERYHALWKKHSMNGALGWGAHALWVKREPIELEAARLAVIKVILSTLSQQPESWLRLLAKFLVYTAVH
jgi:hypothetical protein